MTEPLRLRTQTNDEELSAALRSATLDEPTAEDITALGEAIGVRALPPGAEPGTPGVGTFAARPSAFVLSSVAAVGAAGVIVAAMFAGRATVGDAPVAREVSVSTIAPDSLRAVVANDAAIDPDSPEGDVAAAPALRLAAPKVKPRVVDDAPVERRASETHSDALAREALRLRSVREALSARRLEDAESSLRAYEREFPRGVLLEESLALRARVLHAEGRLDDAMQAARDHVARFPRGLHAEAMRRMANLVDDAHHVVEPTSNP